LRENNLKQKEKKIQIMAKLKLVAADYSEVIVYINMYFFEKISNL